MTAVPCLYKYMSVDTARAVLTYSTLRWSTPATFNDPADMQLYLVLNVEDSVVVEEAIEFIANAFCCETFKPLNEVGVMLNFLKASGIKLNKQQVEIEFGDTLMQCMRKLRKYLPTFNEECINSLASSKILCLSESPLISTMWAHYADDHRGVVLKFGTPDGVDSPWKLARKITYSESPPNFASVNFLPKILAGQAAFDVRATTDLYIYYKSSEWQHEKERRLYSGDGRNSDASFEDVPFHPRELEEIIFGCRVTEGTIGEFSSLARIINPDVSIKLASLSGMKLELKPPPA